MTPKLSIVVPTQRRPGGLARALRSILTQANVDFSTIQLVVVDNDAVPSARRQVSRIVAGQPIRLTYVHEATPGVASARNTAVRASEGDFIAFLDDDEEASPHWLAALLAVQREFDADVVFGPVKGRIPAEIQRHRAYFERFFSRLGPECAGVIPGYYGCGDSLVRRAALPHQTAPFNERRNQGGGEDDLLFSAMLANGARFAWAPEAWVWEDPDPSRLTLRYTLHRAFGFGQGPTSTCASSTPPDWLGVAGWMVQGLAQAIIFSLIAAFAFAFSARRFPLSAERAARGFGKFLWGDRFKPRYYGLAPSAPVQPAVPPRQVRLRKGVASPGKA